MSLMVICIKRNVPYSQLATLAQSQVYNAKYAYVHTHTPSAVLWGTFDQIPHYHGVQGRVRLLNTKTIRLEDFYWDGGGIGKWPYVHRKQASVT